MPVWPLCGDLVVRFQTLFNFNQGKITFITVFGYFPILSPNASKVITEIPVYFKIRYLISLKLWTR